MEDGQGVFQGALVSVLMFALKFGFRMFTNVYDCIESESQQPFISNSLCCQPIYIIHLIQ